MITLAFLITFLMGFLSLNLLIRQEKILNPYLRLFLSYALGSTINVQTIFYSLLLFDRLVPEFIVILNLLILLAALILNVLKTRNSQALWADFKSIPLDHTLMVLAVFLLAVPLWLQANIYPFGGWDAWSAWNLKAKFIFLGEDHWKNVFSPTLWRSSPHYPLFLPLVNVWGWIFVKTLDYRVPLITSLVFPIATAGLLLSALIQFTRSRAAVLAPLLLFSIPLSVTLAASQYCDIVSAYFLLATFVCLILGLSIRSKPLILLTGLLNGSLSFTKPEGMVASIFLSILAVSYILLRRDSVPGKKGFIQNLFIGLAVGFLPTLLFRWVYEPSNITFINGFLSAEHPSTLERLKLVMIYSGFELFSFKWNWTWALLIGGAILNIRGCFKKKFLVIPFFLGLYLSIVLIYYWLNTYFEIRWWLSVTLHRILFTLLPTVILWIFSSYWDVSQGTKVAKEGN